MGVACLEFRGENFHGWLKNCEIRESFLPQKFPAIWYFHQETNFATCFHWQNFITSINVFPDCMVIFTALANIILQVEVLDDESGTSEVLTEGSSFGVKSLLYSSPMESSASALSHVEMFTFSHADFQRVLKDHPSVADSIAELAAKEYGKKVSF